MAKVTFIVPFRLLQDTKLLKYTGRDLFSIEAEIKRRRERLEFLKVRGSHMRNCIKHIVHGESVNPNKYKTKKFGNQFHNDLIGIRVHNEKLRQLEIVKTILRKEVKGKAKVQK